jgi:uncharacterized protein (DUF2141 family)
MTTKLPTLLIALGLAAAASQAVAADLTVTFEGAEPRGQVMVALYDTEAAYDLSRAAFAQQAPATASKVTVTFKDLAPGRYAVKSFQDLNGDGKMSSNPLGMPTEPFGFSNNAPVRMGPPTWAEVAFEVGPTDAAQTIKLQ